MLIQPAAKCAPLAQPLILDGKDKLEVEIKALHEERAKRGTIEYLDKHLVDADARKEVQRLTETRAKYSASEDAFVHLVEAGKLRRGEGETSERNAPDPAQKYLKGIDAFLDVQKQSSVKQGAQAEATYKAALTMLLVLSDQVADRRERREGRNGFAAGRRRRCDDGQYRCPGQARGRSDCRDQRRDHRADHGHRASQRGGSQLHQTTQRNAALVEESAAASDSLKQQAARLTEAVSVFKLRQQSSRAVSELPTASPAPHSTNSSSATDPGASKRNDASSPHRQLG